MRVYDLNGIVKVSEGVQWANITGTPTTLAGYGISSPLTSAQGGTGVANAYSITLGGAISTAGAFSTSGAFALTLTLTGATNVTLPTSGTLVNTVVTTLSSLVSIGTVTTGTWNGTLVAGQYGGTGVANTGKTITLGGNLSTSGAFALTLTLTAATTVTLPTSGTLVNNANGATPTANAGLTAIAGTATTWMRSDGAPALDVTIAPTWSGLHTFNAKIVAAGVSSGAAITSSGTATAYAMQLAGAAGVSAAMNWAPNATISAYDAACGVVNSLITGSAVGDRMIRVENHNFMVSTNAGTNANLTIAGTTGAVTIAAPSSGVPLTVNGTTNSGFIQVKDGTRTGDIYLNSSYGLLIGTDTAHPLGLYVGGANPALIIATTGAVALSNPSSGATLTLNTSSANAGGYAMNLVTSVARGSGQVYQQFTDTTGSKGYIGYGTTVDDIYMMNQLGGQLILGTSNVNRITVSSAGAITLAASTGSTNTLTSNGASGQYAGVFIGNATTARGLLVYGGANSASDVLLSVANAANTTNYLYVLGDGSVGFGSIATTTTAPSAGGAGTLPLTPAGYMTINVNGTARKIAYY